MSIATMDGRVVYCNNGQFIYALADTESPQLLLSLGVTSAEISGIKFFRVPSQVPNAWAQVTTTGHSIVTLYDGLAADARRIGVDPTSLVSLGLAHEVGHIIDSKRSGFRNLNDAKNRIRQHCISRVDQVANGSAAQEVRIESCQRAIGANTRTFEYSADDFAVQVLARKRSTRAIDPLAVAKWFESNGSGHYDPTSSHPDGLERALQFRRSLERYGVSTSGQVQNTQVRTRVDPVSTATPRPSPSPIILPQFETSETDVGGLADVNRNLINVPFDNGMTFPQSDYIYNPSTTPVY